MSFDAKFIRIEPGEFLMGSPKDPKNYPPVKHRITKPFLLADVPVTQDYWRKIMNTNPWEDVPSDIPIKPTVGGKFPAIYVNRNDVLLFIDRLSSQSGMKIFLPTDAQWEYACKAGTETEYFWGNDDQEGRPYAGIDWTQSFNVKNMKMKEVGSLRPNPWGLHDMVGSVAQWVIDKCSFNERGPYLREDHFPKSPIDFVSKNGGLGMLRGIGYLGSSLSLSSCFRVMSDENYKDITFGFRIAAECE